MAHGHETRKALRRAYVNDRMELLAAAAGLSIAANTARRWRAQALAQGDDWDLARMAHGLTGERRQSITERILDDYLVLHQSCIEEVKSSAQLDPLKKAEVLSRLADAFTKTMAAVGKASPDLSRLAVATDVLQRLAGFVRNDFPEHAPALLQVIEPFAVVLSRSYGARDHG